MAYRVVTPAASEPVSLEEARLQCKVDSDDTTWDAWLTANLTTAREWCEHASGRALAPQTLEMAMDAFPACGGAFLLDMPPCSSVASIEYDDADGVEQTLATTVYAHSPYGLAREVSLKAGQSWPATLDQANAVRVTYSAGAATCPPNAKAAILLHLELTFPNNPLTESERAGLERARDSLLDTLKVWGC